MPNNDDQHAELVAASLKNFRVIFSSVKKHFTQIESLYGVSSSQLWVIWEIHKAPGIKVSELATKLAIHQSTTSNLIEKLVKKSWVVKERAEADQRVVRLFLTASGLDIIKHAPASPRGVLIDALDKLSSSELSTLHQSLELLISKIKSKDETDALKSLMDL